MAGTFTRGELTAAPPRWFVPDWATDADEAALRRLLRETPMDGRLRMTLQREPHFFRAAAVEGDRHYTAVARNPDTGEPCAMCSRSVRERFVNGTIARVGYLSQLRIAPIYRARKRPLLQCGFEWLRDTRRADEAPFDITTIIADNAPARRLLSARLPGLPVYRELETVVTLLLPVRRFARQGRTQIARGSVGLREALLACLARFGQCHQFTPHWTAQNLSPAGPGLGDFFVAIRGDHVVGCVALWDQRAFKQAVVRSYDRALARWRPLLNLCGARLPPVGATLSMAFLSHLAVDDENPEVFTDLVAAAVSHAHHHSDCQWLALGLASRHPLVAAARRFRPREYASILYAVHDPDMEVRLDHRVPHVEVALL